MGGVTSDIFAPDEQVLSDFSIGLAFGGLASHARGHWFKLGTAHRR
jgi:hypothetical protein